MTEEYTYTHIHIYIYTYTHIYIYIYNQRVEECKEKKNKMQKCKNVTLQNCKITLNIQFISTS